MAKKQVGVVLSGCGVYDGAEIHEATLVLYFLDRAGARAICMAPNIPQHHVINHLSSSESSSETRNVLEESARLARGNILDLASVNVDTLDALILPGGFGAAKNLSTVAFDGSKAEVNNDLAALIRAMRAAGKPIGALCIAPTVVSCALAGEGILLTIGNDAETAGSIEQVGNRHQESTAESIVVDEANKVVSTAAYMCAAGIAEAGAGIEKLVDKVLAMS